MLVASIQMSIVENDKEASINKAIERVREAADVDLIILPELWNIGFMSFDRYVTEAEDMNGPTLKKCCKRTKNLSAYRQFRGECGGNIF